MTIKSKNGDITKYNTNGKCSLNGAVDLPSLAINFEREAALG